MDLSIRDYIKSNFKEADSADIIASIESSIEENEEETLPGLGVFFEMMWKGMSQKEKEMVAGNILNELK